MSKPVDTGALRDKASWLSKLDHQFGEQVCAAANELDRLRAVIENAPHGQNCPRVAYMPWSCTCWKADAL